MTREWAGVVDRRRSTDGPGAAPSSGSSTAIVGTVRQLRDNELFVRIVELDPELILPYLLSRRGRSQDADPRAHRRRDRRGPGRPARSATGNPVAIARGAAARRPRLRALRAHDGRRRASPRHELDAELGHPPHPDARAMTATRITPGLAGAPDRGRPGRHRPRRHRRRRRARRGHPRACRCSRSTPTTSPSAPRAGPPSWCTAGCATSPTARSASPTRAPSSAAS